MKLSEILNEEQPNDIDITGITCDSRKVQPGFVFAALPGSQIDGQEFIPKAIAQGAVAILMPKGDPVDGVVCIVDHNPRRRYAEMAARFQGAQPRHIAAVTGTNGKTSVVTFVRQLWNALGLPAASAGTLGAVASGNNLDITYPGTLTTPDPMDLHSDLADMVSHGVDHLAVEASSHGLDQYRLDGLEVQVAAFTNLSRDHLDYHKNEENYFQAKRRLFKELLNSNGTAVVNIDALYGKNITSLVIKRGGKVIGYGRSEAADLLFVGTRPTANGQLLSASIFGEAVDIDLPLIGSFQAENALCALGIVLAFGADQNQAIAALSNLAGVRGRLEHAGTLYNGAAVYVDYAHTPDALSTMLKAVRPHVTNKLSVVFGCGGDRDNGKRPLMGEASAQNADRVYVTDDNPRSESADDIRAQAMAGCPSAKNIAGRYEAIKLAISELGAGDILVVAGKGHEQGQTIGNEVLPFDDVEAVTRAIGEVDA